MFGKVYLEYGMLSFNCKISRLDQVTFTLSQSSPFCVCCGKLHALLKKYIINVSIHYCCLVQISEYPEYYCSYILTVHLMNYLHFLTKKMQVWKRMELIIRMLTPLSGGLYIIFKVLGPWVCLCGWQINLWKGLGICDKVVWTSLAKRVLSTTSSF